MPPSSIPAATADTMMDLPLRRKHGMHEFVQGVPFVGVDARVRVRHIAMGEGYCEEVQKRCHD